MKPSTVVIALLCATILAALVAFQLVSASSSRYHAKTGKTKISQVGSVAVIPVTGVKKQILSAMPANHGSGRVVSLQPNDSNSKMMARAGTNVAIAPVYDSTGRLISDPTGTISRSGWKLAPVFDTTGTVVSDPSGTILNTNH